MKDYLEASKDAFLNSFISFSNSNEVLRARVPAALLSVFGSGLSRFADGGVVVVRGYVRGESG